MQTKQIKIQAQKLDPTNNAYLELMEEYLISKVIPAELRLDDKVEVKQSANRFMVHEGKLCKKLVDGAVLMIWEGDRQRQMEKCHCVYNHCGYKKTITDVA